MFFKLLTTALLLIIAGCSHKDKDYVHRQKLLIESTPAPADVYSDGKFIGRSPLSVTLERFQEKETYLSALPTQKHHYRQETILEKGDLPKTILFFMDIPTQNQADSIELLANADQKNNDCGAILPPTIFFKTNKHTTSKHQLEKLKCFVTNLPDSVQTLQVLGHADERDTTDRNRLLALRRAKYVAHNIRLFGFDESKMEVISVGEIKTYTQDLKIRSLHHNRKVTFEVFMDDN